MISGSGNPLNRVALLWWLGAMISVISLLTLPCRNGDLDLSRRSPFDNTGSGHAEQWIFLHEAAQRIPSEASFTVLASDQDIEMSLAMMAVGLLPEAKLLPSSYYGEPIDAGDLARFVLEYGDHQVAGPAETSVATIPGGTLLERRSHRP
jgi:hypothetical protein